MKVQYKILYFLILTSLFLVIATYWNNGDLNKNHNKYQPYNNSLSIQNHYIDNNTDYAGDFSRLVDDSKKYPSQITSMNWNSINKKFIFKTLDNYKVVSNDINEYNQYFSPMSGYSSVLYSNSKTNSNPDLLLSMPINFWNNLVNKKEYFNDCIISDYKNFNSSFLLKSNLLDYDYTFDTNSNSDLSSFSYIIVTDHNNVYIILNSGDNLENLYSNTKNTPKYQTYVNIVKYSDFINNKNYFDFLSTLNENIAGFDETTNNTYLNILDSSIKKYNIDSWLSINSSINSVEINKSLSNNQIVHIKHQCTFKNTNLSFSSDLLLFTQNIDSTNNSYFYNIFYLNYDSNNKILTKDYTLSLSDLKYYYFKNGNPFNYSLTISVYKKTFFSFFVILVGISIILLVIFTITYIYYLKNRWVLFYTHFYDE